MWVFAVSSIFIDPKQAGKEFAQGAADELWNKVATGFLGALDSGALIATFIGMFLYMLGVRRGGKIAWVSLAVWFTIRAVLVSL